MAPKLAYRLLACVATIATTSSAAAVKPEFDWEAITPSRELVYHDCYDEFKCARLEFPLDWLNDSDKRTTAIAVMKLPAVVPEDDPAYAGPIFSNPGGPGGSGTDFLPRIAHHLQLTADKPGRRHYDIMSFDPRGIGHSTPRSECFHENELARAALSLETRGTGGLSGGPAALAYNHALVGGYSELCKNADEDWGAIMAYANTPSVARDMVEMVDRVDELSAKEAAKRAGVADDEWRELRRRKRDAGDVPRLQYIGFSYGTVLGNYFASMFPGRVGRVVLDGVANSEDFANGPGWTTNLVDTDAIFDAFIEGCHAAGPTCALFRYSDTSAGDIKLRVWDFLKALDDEPLTIVTSAGSTGVLSGNDVREVIGSVLYKPIPGFKELASKLAEAMSGNTTALDRTVNDVLPLLQSGCSINGTQSLEVGRETTLAVLCGDGDPVNDKDMTYWSNYVRRLTSMSYIFGNHWASIRFGCSSWPFKANWSFKGPFTTPEADASLVPGKPAAPLLFLSNRLDPVTPLSAARAMAANHPGAGLAIQNALGHCTLTTAASKCMDKILADYFDSGVVPTEETTCEPSCGPWDDKCETRKTNFESWTAHIEQPSVLRPRRFPLGLE